MKKNLSVVVAVMVAVMVAVVAVGCVGPRTAHIGSQHLLATNLIGFVTSQKVGDQPVVTFAQTNFTVTDIPPVTRTVGEVLTGRRPPGRTAPLVLPSPPAAAINGVTPLMGPAPVAPASAPAVAPQPRPASSSGSGGPQYGTLPSGASVLRSGRDWQETPVLLPGRQEESNAAPVPLQQQPRRRGVFGQFADGVKRFLLPTIYGEGAVESGGSYATLTATRGVSGTVGVPVTHFERSALGHAAQIGSPTYRQTGGPAVVVTTRSFGAVVGGGGQFQSGLTGTWGGN